MSETRVEIRSQKPGMLGLPLKDPETGNPYRVLPGQPLMLDAALWAKCEAHEQVTSWIKLGWLTVKKPGGELVREPYRPVMPDLEPLAEKAAVAMVMKEDDADKLRGWLKQEARPKIVEVINKRLAVVTSKEYLAEHPETVGSTTAPKS